MTTAAESAARPGGADPAGGAAERVWAAMRTLVLERHDARPRACAELGLSFFKIKVLRRAAAQPLTMRELTQRLNSDPPYVTVVVDDLVERGLVVREGDPADRRRKIISLTAEGARLAARAEEILSTPPAALQDLPPDELATLDAALARALDATAEPP